MKRWVRSTALLLAGALSVTMTWSPQQTEAVEKDIRVALFIDTGQGYRGVVPTVTLTSDTGLDIKLQGQNGTTKLPAASDMARFHVDEYSVIALESTNYSDAERTAQQLSKQKLDARIHIEKQFNQSLYQVVSGSFTTYDSAVAHSKTVAQKVKVNTKIAGPLRLEAATFDSLQEAKEWENNFEMSGITASTVVVQDKNRQSYAVWLGNESTKAARDNLAAVAKQLYPQFAYEAADAASYVILGEDAISGGNAASMMDYAFSPAAKLVVAPVNKGGTPLIGVEERERRKYRGVIELSEYKGHLTVINELPLEQYLYGVVGSEMATGWPLEALKAQAVLARTRAVKQGNKYGVANLSDTVFEQAYYGFGREAADIRRAVDQTAGEVIRYDGKLVESLYYSNAGGMTAEGIEVWGNPVPYLQSVQSNDSYPQKVAKIWYQVALSDGTIGYLRSDLVDVQRDKNPLGLETAIVNTPNVNFRIGPSTTYHRSIMSLPIGTQVTIIKKEPEENAYSWTRGPYTSAELTAMVNASYARSKIAPLSRPIESLKVTSRGPSGRVLQMEANGELVQASSPDAYRSVFRQGDSSLRSGKFDVQELGSFTVLGANGKKRSFTGSNQSLQVVSGSDSVPGAPNGFSDDFLVLGANQTWRIASKTQKFLFKGNGFGHGLGVSQFGAKALAEQGYDYVQILQHYYKDVTIGP